MILLVPYVRYGVVVLQRVFRVEEYLLRAVEESER